MVYPAEPREAAALVVFDSTGKKVLWAKRNEKLKFLGGFHSFPGGKVEQGDSQVEVRNASSADEAELIACGVRETFEEVGILLVRNGERLTRGQIPLLHDDLVSGRDEFSSILKFWNLWIDANDFHYSGCWTTPEFSPMRFRTSFFAVICPEKQIPYPAITELEEVAFTEPQEALSIWEKGKVLMAPPVLEALQSFEKTKDTGINEFSREYEKVAKAFAESPATIKLTPRIIQFPLRTKTLPPATHTNCFIVGREQFVIIDPATPFEDEQLKLFEVVDQMVKSGCQPIEIIVSHLHPDHFGGEGPLKNHLRKIWNLDVPLSAHPITIESLRGEVSFDQETKNSYMLKANECDFELSVLHSPGHARGHLCFYDLDQGFLLSSDNVVGQGTVVIAPPEGNMKDYLDSLESLKSLPGLRSLAGSHGAAIKNAKSRIDMYVRHRLEREEQILAAFEKGATSLKTITSIVYSDLSAELLPLAEKSVEAHLEKLIDEGAIEKSALTSS